MHLKICVFLLKNMCGNTWGWKSVKIYVMLFKNWKYVFELSYQTGPKYFNTHTAEEMEENLKETDTTSKVD